MRNSPYFVVKALFQLPAIVPFSNMIKWIPLLFTKRTSIDVDGGLDNTDFLAYGTKLFVMVGVLESFCVPFGFIVLLTGVLIVVINERRTNTEMRN